VSKKLTGRELARFEASRDIWQEVVDGVRDIKAGRGKRFTAEPRSAVVRARLRAGLTQSQFAALLGVSKRTLEHSPERPVSSCACFPQPLSTSFPLTRPVPFAFPGGTLAPPPSEIPPQRKVLLFHWLAIKIPTQWRQIKSSKASGYRRTGGQQGNPNDPQFATYS
jgi:transcriptional regulator with XRE-family HTH domain